MLGEPVLEPESLQSPRRGRLSRRAMSKFVGKSVNQFRVAITSNGLFWHPVRNSPGRSER